MVSIDRGGIRVAGCSLSAELKYGKDMKRQARTKRHPLNILFDPFYPFIIATIILIAASWYFDIPLARILEGISRDLHAFLGRWIP